MPLDPIELERRVRSARDLAGIDQLELGDLMKADGHGKHDVGKWERCDPTAPPMTKAKARSLASHTGVPVEWFFEPDLSQVFQSPPPVSLEQDVARLHREVREMGEILGQVPAAQGEALTRLLGRLDATSPTPLERPDEGPGQ